MEKTDCNTNKEISYNKPDSFVFIIGAMKSGTTSLFDILGQHPQICSSKIKEPDYFIKDRDDPSHKDYLSLWNWHNNSHEHALESSVAYTKAPLIPGVPERINRAKLGQYRFIYMLRNPLTRIESQIRHGLFAGWGQSLDAGIPEDAIYYSSYAMQLEKYLGYFPKQNFKLITLEEFIESPDNVLTEICQFLDIDKDFEFIDVKTTRNSGDFFNTTPIVSRITQSNLGQFIARKILPAGAKNQIRHYVSLLSKKQSKPADLGRWQLTSEECDTIIKMLTDDLLRLESDFGVDIHKFWHIQPDTLETTQADEK